MIIHHSVRFYRQRGVLGDISKAVCSCGWAASGDQHFVNVAAATHDLHDEQDDEAPNETHSRQAG